MGRMSASPRAAAVGYDALFIASTTWMSQKLGAIVAILRENEDKARELAAARDAATRARVGSELQMLANRICDALDLIDHERGLLDREYACARRIASAVGTEAALEKNSDVRAAVSRAIGENVDGCRNIASRTVSMMSGASRAIGFDESHHTASRARDARD